MANGIWQCNLPRIVVKDHASADAAQTGAQDVIISGYEESQRNVLTGGTPGSFA
jgi:hypothetical protein